MSPKRGTGRGMYLNQDGYLRISRRGPLRDQMAHRAYVNRQLAWPRCDACGTPESAEQREYDMDCKCGGRFIIMLPPLRDDQEVHHLCRNRACWPPTDFHLVILDQALHHAFEGGKHSWDRRYKNMVAKGEAEVVSEEIVGTIENSS